MAKILLPQKTNQVNQNSVTLLPAVEGLIADSLQIIQAELLRYSQKSKSGKSLDLREARVLQGYIKAMVELSKENRERSKDDDFSKMSTEELTELLQVLIAKRQVQNNS